MSALDKQIGGTHYRQGGIQPVQYIEANNLKYLEASVVKRVTRHDKETGKGRQDIEKAIHELELLLELRYAPTSTSDGVIAALRDAATPICGKCGNRHSLYVGCDFPVINRGLTKACLVCGASDGHGGLQCPNMVATCNAGNVGAAPC